MNHQPNTPACLNEAVAVVPRGVYGPDGGRPGEPYGNADWIAQNHEAVIQFLERSLAAPAAGNEKAGAVALSDEQIIERCKAVGIIWLAPDLENDPPSGGGFPGSFDMVTMVEMRNLLAAHGAAIDAREQEAKIAPVPYDKHEAEVLAVIDERDRYHDMADQLAAQIAAITGDEIGEHSSDNDPWHNAMLSADEWIARDLRAMFSGDSEPYLKRFREKLASRNEALAAASAQPQYRFREEQPDGTFIDVDPSEALSPATVAQPVGWQGRASPKQRWEDVPFDMLVFRRDIQKWEVRPVFAQPCASQGCGGAAVRHALQQIVDADDAQALTQQLIDIGRAALSTAPRSLDAAPEQLKVAAYLVTGLSSGEPSICFEDERGDYGDEDHMPVFEALCSVTEAQSALSAQAASLKAKDAEIDRLRADARDPLQGAANWLYTGLVECTVADLQSRLLVGYNRAKRLFDAARTPHD
jgi:hypothetical protein